MRRYDRLQKFNVVGGSIIVHLLLLAWVLPYQPRLSDRLYAEATAERVIPVFIIRRADKPPPRPPPTAIKKPKPAQPRPTAVRVTPIQPPQEALPVAPLVAPPEPPPLTKFEPPPPDPPPPSAVVLRPYGNPSPGDDAALAGVRGALRGSLLGCANPSALTRAERDKCLMGMAAGAKNAAFPGLGLSGAKMGDLAAERAKKDADIRYRDSALTGEPAGGSSGDGFRPPTAK